MSELKTDASFVINFLKKNYIIIAVFILTSLLVSLFLTFQFNKKNELYFSKFQVIFNEASTMITPLNLVTPYKDLLFHLEKKNIFSKKVIKSKHANVIIQLEINHEDINDKNLEQYNRYVKYVEDYKQILLSELDDNIQMFNKDVNLKIKNSETKDVSLLYEVEALKFTSNANRIKKMIKNNQIFYIHYDGQIQSRKVKTLLLKNAVISVCVSIIIILSIIWVKIFLRQIKQNS